MDSLFAIWTINLLILAQLIDSVFYQAVFMNLMKAL